MRLAPFSCFFCWISYSKHTIVTPVSLSPWGHDPKLAGKLVFVSAGAVNQNWRIQTFCKAPGGVNTKGPALCELPLHWGSIQPYAHPPYLLHRIDFQTSVLHLQCISLSNRHDINQDVESNSSCWCTSPALCVPIQSLACSGSSLWS